MSLKADLPHQSRLDEVTGNSIERVRSLLEAPTPAVLTTYRKDRSALVSPVWFRFCDGVFEVVIAKGDLKLRHMARDPRCVLVVFEAVRPFRGGEVRGVSELVECDVSSVRTAIARRYLGEGDGARFAAQRIAKPGVLLRLTADNPRVWDLSTILPTPSREGKLRHTPIIAMTAHANSRDRLDCLNANIITATVGPTISI